MIGPQDPAQPGVHRQPATRFLVAGWFSFEQGHATAGDLLARDLVCDWLHGAGYAFDFATAPPFTGGVDVRSADPAMYSHVVVVCGPFEKGELEHILLKRFWRCRLIGLDLSMQVPVEEWQPFDLLIERDSSKDAHPDFVFASDQPLVPVVGVCLVEDYPAGMTEVANAAIRRLIDSQNVAVFNIDTRLDTNSTGFRSPAEIESAIARVDVMVTTRLHGTVLALKRGIPVLAIDPEPGGAKIRRQASTIGWPVIFDVADLSEEALLKAFRYCLTAEAREHATRCGERAAAAVHLLRARFLHALPEGGSVDTEYARRMEVNPEFLDWTPIKPEPNVSNGDLLQWLKNRIPAQVRERTRRWLGLSERSRAL
jgi:hypothetical protein